MGYYKVNLQATLSLCGWWNSPNVVVELISVIVSLVHSYPRPSGWLEVVARWGMDCEARGGLFLPEVSIVARSKRRCCSAIIFSKRCGNDSRLSGKFTVRFLSRSMSTCWWTWCVWGDLKTIIIQMYLRTWYVYFIILAMLTCVELKQF